ncbi:hypothetical protein [Halovenus aranensis]|nr:hypothetical protein [Halovenus aranensis]
MATPARVATDEKRQRPLRRDWGRRKAIFRSNHQETLSSGERRN